MTLPAEFEARMKEILGEDFGRFIEVYTRPAERGIRVNTLKISVEEFKKISPFKLEQIPWESCGFYADGESLGKTVLHAAGLYYVQEPSAMSVAPKLGKGERVLDLCSAPGGKGTQLAQYMQGEGTLFLNEISLPRAKILSSNVERLGIKNAVVINSDSEKLSEQFENYFDRILVDAPCSGEGMFKKEENAIAEWSLQNVAMCAERQAEILKNAHKLLAGGGKIIYSTCTFSPEEDEKQVENFLRAFPDMRLLEMKKLYPHEVRGEGHFYALMEKAAGEMGNLKALQPTVKDKKLLEEYRVWERENLNIKMENLHFAGGVLYSLPKDFPSFNLHILRAGVRLGEFVKDRFEPSHSLAMCLKKGEANGVEVDEKTALNFLRGLTFEDGGKGYKLVLFQGKPLGWGKVSSGIAKNKLPKGVRI